MFPTTTNQNSAFSFEPCFNELETRGIDFTNDLKIEVV